MKVFFVKYNDPIYVKLEKLDIMIRLASQANIAQVIKQLQKNSVLYLVISDNFTEIDALLYFVHVGPGWAEGIRHWGGCGLCS